MATIFTKIINREIPAEIVYENDYVIAIKDINPIAPVHILVITKKEIPTLNDVTNEDAHYISEAFLAIKEVAKKVGIAEQGYRVVSNCNEYGGQTVFHVHFHILGGTKIIHEGLQ